MNVPCQNQPTVKNKINMTLEFNVDYKQYKVETAPCNVYYIPNFISEVEENQLSKCVYSVPKPKWTCLSKRRLQDYGGIPHKNGMIVEDIPDWLHVYMKKVDDLNVFEGKKSNHVLINEYLPGQGIMPHTDGPLFYPTVTTINCSSHTILEFRENILETGEATEVCKLLLEPRSLLILKDNMYNKYLHSISEQICDVIDDKIVNLNNCGAKFILGQTLQRNTRLSITIRNVPKVAKLNLKLWK